MSFHIINKTKDDYKTYVTQNMFAFNASHFPAELRTRYEPLNLFLVNQEGEVAGGIVGEFCWNWLEVHYLYVDENIRKMGYGRQLLRAAELRAKEKQCDFIKLDTLSFQALAFYQNEGFEIFGTIENAGGYKHYYLKKDL
ncbi:GNAT family N-acetyltransferase [Paenibacillus daejeonensis]|uniref:GNAT family N-acetyltransferase n=1 Tax=Paenibacillus daejeonensis TaxID=135193 RepID=UPI0003718F0C|nr:GNAT family N-acetyltransferase [Paenibacillus daejeonensis]